MIEETKPTTTKTQCALGFKLLRKADWETYPGDSNYFGQLSFKDLAIQRYNNKTLILTLMNMQRLDNLTVSKIVLNPHQTPISQL